MSMELRVKALSLAAEAAIIRRQQRRLEAARHRKAHYETRKILDSLDPPKEGESVKEVLFRAFDAGVDLDKWLNGNDPVWMALQHHRRHDVRQASRETHLARMFVAGTPYRAAEYKVWTEPSWGSVTRMVRRYAPDKLFGKTERIVVHGTVHEVDQAIIAWWQTPATNEMVEQAAKAREAREKRDGDNIRMERVDSGVGGDGDVDRNREDNGNGHV